MDLTPKQLTELIRTAFAPGVRDRCLGILVDLPDARVPDEAAWRETRGIAYEWYTMLHEQRDALGLSEVRLYAYGNVGSNNAALPQELRMLDEDPVPLAAGDLGSRGRGIGLSQALGETQILLAPTLFSTTAPLKLLARKIPFRAATMPGFTRAFLPSLGVDYGQVHAKVSALAERLEKAEGATVVFSVGEERHRLELDLRFRHGHASSGLMREPGQVGNLPSGEAYIAPYEGECEGEASLTAGILPVQFGTEVVLYEVSGNRARRVLSKGPESEKEAAHLEREPAYGNIAELGLGILGEFGIQPVGATLLDEKLGLHVAFGRSDHFGGVTSPAKFTSPSEVVHIDWVYVPSLQPRIVPEEVVLTYESRQECVMVKGRYLELGIFPFRI